MPDSLAKERNGVRLTHEGHKSFCPPPWNEKKTMCHPALQTVAERDALDEADARLAAQDKARKHERKVGSSKMCTPPACMLDHNCALGTCSRIASMQLSLVKALG